MRRAICPGAYRAFLITCVQFASLPVARSSSSVFPEVVQPGIHDEASAFHTLNVTPTRRTVKRYTSEDSRVLYLTNDSVRINTHQLSSPVTLKLHSLHIGMYAVGLFVEDLRYKPGDRGFDGQWGH
jgi:hypothetical protein